MVLNLQFNNFTFQGKKFTKFANVNIFEFQKKVDQPKKYDKIKLILLYFFGWSTFFWHLNMFTFANFVNFFLEMWSCWIVNSTPCWKHLLNFCISIKFAPLCMFGCIKWRTCKPYNLKLKWNIFPQKAEEWLCFLFIIFYVLIQKNIFNLLYVFLKIVLFNIFYKIY